MRDLNKIQSEAYREVEEIRGVADARATEIYAGAYNQSPEAVEHTSRPHVQWQTWDLVFTRGGKK